MYTHIIMVTQLIMDVFGREDTFWHEVCRHDVRAFCFEVSVTGIEEEKTNL